MRRLVAEPLRSQSSARRSLRIGLRPVAIDDPAEDRDEQPGCVELAGRQRLARPATTAARAGLRIGLGRSRPALTRAAIVRAVARSAASVRSARQVARSGGAGEPEVVGGRPAPGHRQPRARSRSGADRRRSALDVLDRPAEELQPGRVELVRPLAGCARAG